MLPEAFEEFREAIEDTIQPVIHITTVERATTLFESKFAGDPYFPVTKEYPKNPKGQPLKLLAQINFAEVPDCVPNVPKHGILQFFINPQDDVFGLNFEDGTQPNDFRVIFHENVIEDASQLIQDFSFIDEIEDEYFPIEVEMGLCFEQRFEAMSGSDFRSERAYAVLNEKINENDDLYDTFYNAFDGTGHKIGGYPFFTQEDPRGYGDNTKHEILLLQIDSIGDHIMWGDVGVANFFVTEDDLKKRDFSKVLYNWDCH